MKPILESKPLSETILFNQYGVKIIAHIDYEKETVSLVDELGQPFKYTFVDRGVEYLGGWVKIFHALEAVTRECDKKLKEYKKIRDEEFMYKLLEFNSILENEK